MNFCVNVFVACNSSCTGLNQCYGAGADQCCSYNDDGNCVADCGMNREGNSTFHCVCSDFWTGTNCTGMLQLINQPMFTLHICQKFLMGKVL